MKLWSSYQQEKYGRKTIIGKDENGIEIGFITYNVYDDGSCLVDTLFVEKESRNKGFGKELEAKLIERESDVTDLFCEIDFSSIGADLAFTQMFMQGYKFIKFSGNQALMKRSI
jgi:GNAT superfamily N-acetyltransferase